METISIETGSKYGRSRRTLKRHPCNDSNLPFSAFVFDFKVISTDFLCSTLVRTFHEFLSNPE